LYRAFTNEFDEIISAKSLKEDETFRSIRWNLRCLRYAFDFRKTRHLVRTREIISDFETNRASLASSDIVAVVLVDHSGSLRRDNRAFLALNSVELITDFLCMLDVPHEILGFTTSSWRGGKSRTKWMDRGKPESPGRLCDLLYIVYREFDEPSHQAPPELLHILNYDLLKENVDGEALLTAASRLERRAESHKLVFMVSDGAPVDDSTLLANGSEYLTNHLKEVIEKLEINPMFGLYGIGIGYDVGRYYGNSLNINNVLDLRESLPAFVNSALADIV